MNVLTRPTFDIERIRADFPILGQSVHGKPLVFLDSAASAQKPRQVIAAMVEAMETQYANVHRGLHWMSERTTDAYEGVRGKIARLLNAIVSPAKLALTTRELRRTSTRWRGSRGWPKTSSSSSNQ